jgi:hypothetical protein
MRLRLALSLLVLAACGGGSERAGTIGELGAVCGSSAIIGVPQKKVTSSVSRQCGIANPVRLHEVAGIALRQRPLVNCKTAKALEQWVRKGVKPAMSDLGARLESLRVVAHYTCRTRNSQRGARVSEHGKGNAIDIAGFRLRDGSEISVLRDWARGEKGRALASMRRSACGPFGVVLGPGSDRFHDDHFHLDTSNLSRPYCR